MKKSCLVPLCLFAIATSPSTSQNLSEVELLHTIEPTVENGVIVDHDLFPDSKRIAFLELSDERYLLNIYDIERRLFVTTVHLDSLEVIGIGPHSAGLSIAMNGQKIVVGNHKFAIYDSETEDVSYVDTKSSGSVLYTARTETSTDGNRVCKMGNRGVFVLDVPSETIVFSYVENVDIPSHVRMQSMCFSRDFQIFAFAWEEQGEQVYQSVYTEDKSVAPPMFVDGVPFASRNEDKIYSISLHEEHPQTRLTSQSTIEPFENSVVPLNGGYGIDFPCSFLSNEKYLLTSNFGLLIGYEVESGEPTIVYDSYIPGKPLKTAGHSPKISSDNSFIATNAQEAILIYSSPIVSIDNRTNTQEDCEANVTTVEGSKQIHVELTLSTPSEVNLSVFDITGNPVYIMNMGQYDAGTHIYEIPETRFDSLPHGTYFVQISNVSGVCCVSPVQI